MGDPRWKPAHISIVSTLNTALRRDAVLGHGFFIRETWFPEGHAEIEEAWISACRTFEIDDGYAGPVLDVIREQARVVAIKAAAKSAETQAASDRDNPYPNDPHERM